jgi:hypothetical protein
MRPHTAGILFAPARTGLLGAALLLGLALLPAAVGAQPSPAAPDNPAASDAPAAADAPALEVVDLTAQAAFSSTAPRAGDSLDYVLTVEWPETGIPVMLLAPDSLEFSGLQVIGQATSHKKLASAGPDGQPRLSNRTVFTWRLRAQVPGCGKASSVRLRWLTGLSRNEEQRFVPATHLDILPGLAPLLDRLLVRLLLGWLALAFAGCLAYGAFQLGKLRKSSKPDNAKADLRPGVLALKARIKSAGAAGASREIIEEMENLAVRHLSQELAESPGTQGSAPAAIAFSAKFDPLLDRYLARKGDADLPSADWNALRELFRHARFAGGHKEPHELQDAWRTLKRCLKITEEPGDE